MSNILTPSWIASSSEILTLQISNRAPLSKQTSRLDLEIYKMRSLCHVAARNGILGFRGLNLLLMSVAFFGVVNPLIESRYFVRGCIVSFVIWKPSKVTVD